MAKIYYFRDLNACESFRVLVFTGNYERFRMDADCRRHWTLR